MFVHFPHIRLITQLALVGLITLLIGTISVAQALPGEVLAEQKISAASGGLLGPLADDDAFGSSATGIGDLDGDGNVDIALGASLDDAGVVDAGAVYILFLNADGTVKAEQKISATSGGFTGALEAGDRFGSAVSGIGDLDGDGATELAVGARLDDDGLLDRGAVWILFLHTDGTVKRHEKVSFAFGSVRPDLMDGDSFGAVTAIGDLDRDGTTELAVGAPGDATGGADAGAVWILFMLPDGTVHALQEIDGVSGNFAGPLLAGDAFGTATAELGDLDGDGVADVAVSAASDQDGGPGRGAVWILFLNDDGTVKASQKISSTQGAFTGVLNDGDSFGSDLEGVGDLDGDGVADLAVGAVGDDDGGTDRGAVWVLFLNTDGTVKAHQKVADMTGGFAGTLDDADGFGAIGAIGDLDGDGISELVATAIGDDDGGTNRGAAYVLSMDGSAIVCGNAIADPVEECDDANTLDFDGCTATCENEDSIEFFGAAGSAGLLSVTIDSVVIDLALVAGDTPNQIAQLLVAAINSDPTLSASGTTAQAVGPKVFTNGKFTSAVSSASGTSASFDPGSVLAEQKVSDTQGGFTGGLDDLDHFGNAAAMLGDVDGDGIADLAVGSAFDSDGGLKKGALWILFLNADGSVKGHQKINDLEGGFLGLLEDSDRFGSSAAPLGDLDGDGIVDVAVGARDDDDAGGDRGAVWILFLNADGTVKSHQKISSLEGGFTGALDNFDFFGVATASLGDLDGDGVVDLGVGAFSDDDGAPQSGAVWILFLNTDGTVKAHQKISNTQGGFGGVAQNSLFGGAVASLGDLDGDGVSDLAVGSSRDGDGGPARGAVWILFLNADGTVKAEQKISDTAGGFTGKLDNEDDFGSSATAVGDVNADGLPDVAVGALDDDDGGAQTGSVWILFLNADGTVKGHQKVSDLQGGFVGGLDRNDFFGVSTASLGDLNGDGSIELAIGAFGDDDGGEDRGAVWILSLDGSKFAVCADDQVFFPETCDDGNLISGDGCFSTCQIEDDLTISGTAAGGSVEIVVSGISILVITTAGESAAEVVTNLSTTLNADLSLQSAEVSSVDLAERLVTNGTIDSIVNSDLGLTIDAACSNGIDDDGDGLIDLADPGCADASDDDETDPITACSNGLDDDGDGQIDLADPGCADASDNDEQSAALVCDNGLDDDGDTLIDLADPGCADSSDPDETDPITACSNGLDDDGDGQIDLADPGCDDASDNDEQSAALVCDNGLDDDGDGQIDLADPGCADSNDPDELNAAIACDNGLDDDGDTLIDLADPGCADSSDPDETDPIAACANGLDDDGDGLIDLADPGCDDESDDSERGAIFECDNGLDDDGDGLIDFPDDDGCLHPTNLVEAPEPGFSAMIAIGALALGLLRRRNA